MADDRVANVPVRVEYPEVSDELGGGGFGAALKLIDDREAVTVRRSCSGGRVDEGIQYSTKLAVSWRMRISSLRISIGYRYSRVSVTRFHPLG